MRIRYTKIVCIGTLIRCMHKTYTYKYSTADHHHDRHQIFIQKDHTKR